jgi:RNA polymerase subunit RPABC4/transcription elongation factor Spt4
MAGLICKHVYRIMNADICPKCDKPTHETDWKLVAQQHKDWIASGKAELQGWWSI